MEWKDIAWRAAPALLVILLVSYFAGGGWQAFPSALVAWGTLMLAYVTFLSIKKSVEQSEKLRTENERLRQEDRNRELNRHAIEFMYNWARHVSEFTFLWYPFDNKGQLLNLWENASRLRIDALEARQYSFLFNAKLREAVKKAADDFADFTHAALKASEESPTYSIPESGKDLIRESQNTANDSAQDLVTLITDLKMNLKL
jgi:hypothetical protein